MSESRLPGSKGDVAKKITVRLWGGGVFAKNGAVQGSANTQYFQRKAGQLIYSKLDFLNQAFGIIPDDLDGYESTADLPCFDISGDLNPAFILECVKRKDFYLRVGEAADGSRIAKRIHPETFLASEIPLPSLHEQQKVADCLDSVDLLIAAQGRKVEALKAHKKGLMQQLFPQEGETQPRLRFPEFEGSGEWEEGTISDIGTVLQGYGFPERYQGQQSGDFPFYKVSDISRSLGAGKTFLEEAANYVNENQLKELRAKPIPAGTAVFAKIGEAIRSNKRAITTIPCLIDNNAAGVKSIKGKATDFFIHLTMEQISLIDHAGGVVPAVNKSAIEAIPVKFPQVAEQQRIADCFTSLDDLIAAETRKLDTLKTHKKGLIQQLFPRVGEADT